MEPSLYLFPTILLLTITEDGDISLQQFGLQDGSGLFVWNGVTVSVFKHLLYTYYINGLKSVTFIWKLYIV